MSFLFKSSKKVGPTATTNALPAATRDIRSSDGSGSQIPTLNGLIKSTSPTPVSGNSSLTALNGADRPNGSARQSEDIGRDDAVRSASLANQEPKMLRDPARDTRSPVQARPPIDNSPYPWSQRRLTFTTSPNGNPFPRYGAAVNTVASKDGSVYMMGGLINGSTVKGDLWIVEASTASLNCYPVATTSEGPGPRVGHASLLVGNAFIVFGGDTKLDDGDMLDDTLYLLNTSTKQWSRALPAGPRPPGRYGHSLNILGSKIYIFGGQVEGYFFNDLVAFDLNALQQPTNRWEILIQNTIDGGPPHGQIPAARTNHSMVTYGDRLYLFGGTDGVHWFNDVWSFSPQTHSWTQLECIGYIPSAREGHAAALVGDVMYIFGGRTEEGIDLGDLAAFRISTRRWYTFANMGPSPSPRSGHSMTTVGKQVIVLCGEPSSAPRDPIELGLAYLLDTTKIKYPADPTPSPAPPADRTVAVRQPNGIVNAAQKVIPRESQDRERSGSNGDLRIRSPDGSRLPRAQGQLPAPSGPPPQAPAGRPGTGATTPTSRQPTRTPDRALSPANENDRPQRFDNASGAATDALAAAATRGVRMPTSSAHDSESVLYDAEQNADLTRQKPKTYQPSQDATEPYSRSGSRNQPSRGETERYDEPTRRPSRSSDAGEVLTKVRKLSEEQDVPQDSGIGSSPAHGQRSDALLRELEQTKQRNAWYASELALARKAGYQARATESPVLDDRASDVLNDEDKPLVEALLKMRAELARVQDKIDQQSKSAAARIAEVEKARDEAINQAALAKARLAGQATSPSESDAKNGDIAHRLASSLETQTQLTRQIDLLKQEVEAEKRSRELAEETVSAAQKRVDELDTYRQQHSAEIESLRSELHEAQREARDASASHAEIASQHKLLTVDHSELSDKLTRSLADTQSHTTMLTSLRDAVTSSAEKSKNLEKTLDEERNNRNGLEVNLRELSAQHDQRASELEHTQKQLREAQEEARRHAEEAEMHRTAVLAGLGTLADRGTASTSAANDERVTILQQQVESANALVRQNQAAADSASEKLRRAEERIAGLEAYQEQASREGLTIRKQLQSLMKENQTLAGDKSSLEQRVEKHMLESNALAVQHASLKDILGERGVSASDIRRSRAIDSPSSARFSTPDLHRVRELEQQLEATLKSHDDMKAQFEDISERDENMKREYEDKLTALDNDHQAAVKYLRGTEKMLSRMKQELQRVKNENGDLKKKIDKGKESKDDAAASSAEWQAEREKLNKEMSDMQESHQTTLSDLESKISTIQRQLHDNEQSLQESKTQHATSQRDLATLHTSHTQTKADIERLQKENITLEERARDAENKVQLLLDQVEHSVDNYRRQSRLLGAGQTQLVNGTHHSRHDSDTSAGTPQAHTPAGHARNISSGGDSTFSLDDANSTAGDARNSLALDSLASELETLRSHWETTNRNYRLSDRSDPYGSGSLAAGLGLGLASSGGSAADRPLALNTSTSSTGPAATTTHATSHAAGSLGDWRKGLDFTTDEEDDEDTDEAGSRPHTATARRSPSADENLTPTAAVPHS